MSTTFNLIDRLKYPLEFAGYIELVYLVLCLVALLFRPLADVNLLTGVGLITFIVAYFVGYVLDNYYVQARKGWRQTIFNLLDYSMMVIAIALPGFFCLVAIVKGSIFTIQTANENSLIVLGSVIVVTTVIIALFSKGKQIQFGINLGLGIDIVGIFVVGFLVNGVFREISLLTREGFALYCLLGIGIGIPTMAWLSRKFTMLN
jgi:hypothetical protein